VGRDGVSGTLPGPGSSALRGGEQRVMLPYVIAAVIAVPVLWLCGDLLHSLLMRWLDRRWEARIERDPEGVRVGCREFVLGDGEDAVLLVHGYGDSPGV